jgi:phosphatidylglycerol:prolipoprotein diacylglycerol transferase
MGMLLSVPMLVIGAILIVRASRMPRVNAQAPSMQAPS